MFLIFAGTLSVGNVVCTSAYGEAVKAEHLRVNLAPEIGVAASLAARAD